VRNEKIGKSNKMQKEKRDKSKNKNFSFIGFFLEKKQKVVFRYFCL
jgi:hypothetical protein